MWKIQLELGQNLFFTSDTHYNHKNICRGVTNWRNEDGTVPVDQTRDFPNLDKMNAVIAGNINDVVGQDDILIHLGDWSFGGFDSIKEFRDRIVCRNIHLILGNHDHHIENNRSNIQKLFSSVRHYGVLMVQRPSHPILTQSKYINIEFVLMHYPIASWHDMRKGRFHLHGHVHLSPDQKIATGRAIDVGMDGNDMKPYSLSEVVRLLNPRPVRTLSLPSDHHEEGLKGEQ